MTTDIIKNGAVGDGVTLCTAAIQSAIEAANRAGGGRVLIPVGRWLTGSIRLLGGVELHLEHGAHLLGSTRHEDYPGLPLHSTRSNYDDERGFPFFSLVWAYHADNIALTGTGTIDGQGDSQKPRNEATWNFNGRPQGIMFVGCRGVVMTDLRLRDSGMWMIHLFDCEDVKIRGLDIYNHVKVNNDGIDIDCCRRVVVSDCLIDSDDDAMCLKSSGDLICEDVSITNCVLSSRCNAIKLGTDSVAGFRNISVSHCVVTPSRASHLQPKIDKMRDGFAAISLCCVDGGVMESVHLSDILIRGTLSPIYIRLATRNKRPGSAPAVPGKTGTRNIVLENITAVDGGAYGSAITGVPGLPIKGITLRNIDLIGPGGITDGGFESEPNMPAEGYPQGGWFAMPASGLYLCHAEQIRLENVRLTTETPDARPPLVCVDVKDLETASNLGHPTL